MKIALDLGGTNVRAAIVDGDTIIEKRSEPCKSRESAGVVVNQIISLIEPLVSADIDGIGVGVPSVVDSDKGIVYNACNIPSWKEVPLKSLLEGKFGLRTLVNNDCNCFVLGEYYYGESRGLSNVVGITLGTGVGSGLILDGRLYCGAMCGAGEVGSLPYLDSDYEHYCSSLWLNGKHATNGASLAARASKGDSEALAIWNEFGHHLGELTKAILYAYAPEAMVVGGGIAEAMPYFRKGWEESVSTFPYRRIAEGCRLLKAGVKDAGLLGATRLFSR